MARMRFFLEDFFKFEHADVESKLQLSITKISSNPRIFKFSVVGSTVRQGTQIALACGWTWPIKLQVSVEIIIDDAATELQRIIPMALTNQFEISLKASLREWCEKHVKFFI